MSSPHLQRALAELYGEPAPEAQLVRLRGDASTRSYFRAHIEGAKAGLPSDLIVMQLPEDAFRSDEAGEQPTAKRLPFLEVAELLASRGLPVPTVYAEDLDHGVVLLEDLGDVTLHEELGRVAPEKWPELYGRAVDLLAELHARCGELPKSSIVARRRFDRALLDWELEHFREWGLQALFGELEPKDAAALSMAFETIADRMEGMPYGFVHRDYQSKNLMVRSDGALALIDFQDALMGPRVYDLVALLCDSYVALDIEKIVSLKPQLCLAIRDGNPKAVVDRLEALGIPVYVFDPQSLEAIVDTVERLGSIYRQEARAEVLAAGYRQRLARVARQIAGVTDRPGVFFQIDAQPVISAGSDTFLHQLLTRSGNINLAADRTGYPRYTWEELLVLKPEVVLLASMGGGYTDQELRSRWQAWPQIPAVRNNRLYVVDADLFDRPTPRLIDALEYLVGLLHPEQTDIP